MPQAAIERVVVLGAGPCGLSAALRLAEAGLSVHVLEREPLVGGLAASHRRDGYTFDLGGHRLISPSHEILDLARGLLGPDLLLRERRSAILLGGRRFHYPLELLDVLTKLSPVDGALALAGYLVERARGALHPRPADSFEGWVTARFGAPLYRRFFGPYTRKLWGIPPSELSADWAAQRISLSGLGDVVRRLLGRRRAVPRTYARRYLYPRRGMGQLFEALAARVERAGGEVRLSTEPTALVRSADGRVRAVRCAATDASGVEDEVPCDHLVSTIPLPALAALLGEGPEPAARLRFRALRFLNIRLDRPALSDQTWLYVGDPRYIFTRVQEPRQRSPESAPPGRTSVMLEIPCWVGDGTWTAPDDALLARALDDLDHLGLRVRRDVLGCFSTRAPEAYPVYRRGYQAHRDALLLAVARAGNVTTVGRQGLFRYLFMDAAMAMGLRAADRIARGEAPRHEDLLRLRDARTLQEVQSVA